MAIRIEHGKLGTVGEMATMAGRSKALGRQHEIETRLLMQERSHQQAMKMANFRAELDEKAWQKAQVWEFEKMEMRSRNDFENMELKRTMKAQAEAAKEIHKESQIEADKTFLGKLHKNGNITDHEYTQRLIQLETDQKPMRPEGTDETSPFSNIVKRLAGGITPDLPFGLPAQTPTQTPAQRPAIAAGEMYVISPSGTVGTISKANWPEAQKKGYTQIEAEQSEEPEKGTSRFPLAWPKEAREKLSKIASR